LTAIQIRPARIEDSPALARIVIDATQDAFRGRVPDRCLDWLTPEESAANWARNFEPGQSLDQGAYLLVAEMEAGQVVGLAMAGRSRVTGHGSDQYFATRYRSELYTLQVDPHWQRRGIGCRLVSHVAGVLSGEGETHLLVGVLAENPNRLFYERLDAVRLGSQPYDWEGYATEEFFYGWDDLRSLCSL